MTLRNLIYSSLRLIQVAEQGQYVLTSQQEEEAVLALQSLVSSWSTNRILLPYTITEEFNLQEGKSTYEIGPDQEFNTQSPQRILSMYAKNSGNFDKSIFPINQSDYFSLAYKNMKAAICPNYFYYQFGYPYSMIYFWPVPSVSIPIVMASHKNFDFIGDIDLNTILPLPPPYLDALKFNLAVAIAPEYATDVPEAVAARAAHTITNIIKMSTPDTPVSRFDFGSSPYNRYEWDTTWFIR